MAHRETVIRTIARAGKLTGAWITGGVLLFSLASAQLSPAAQQLPAQPNAVRQQLGQAGQATPAKPPAPAAQAPAKPAAPAPKPATTPQKPASAAAPKPPTTAAAKPAVTPTNRRDPFAPLLRETNKAGALPEHLPPGKAGLVIATLRLDGIVSGPNGMIAIVSNPQQRTYFLREGDQLYDGSVNKITLAKVSFHETGKDPFGKPIEREVEKPLSNATPGESQ